MKKIGILTFWAVPNYGAFLQAYALQKIIQKRYKNFEVKQIPYLNEKHYNTYYSRSIKKNYRYWIINPKFYVAFLHRKEHDKQVESLKRFIDYYNDLIPNYNEIYKLGIENLKVDTLILGSDIIWDYSEDFFGSDGYLFGNGINAETKISYAPSFGSVSGGFDAPTYVKRGVNELTAVSVRDKKSVEIVKNISGKTADVVLDPTLLWNFIDDENVVKPNSQKYIVVYGSFFTQELILGAKKYSKMHNLRLICLSSLDDRYDWCDENINQDELNPFEWVGYFKYADAVMTCTYHGLLFSLIFKKKIIFNMTEFILNKSQSFIEDLGLSDVLVNFNHFDEKINWNWNYKEIDDKLEMLRQKSFDFLDGVICNE